MGLTVDFEHQARMTKARKIAEHCRTSGIRAEVLTHEDKPVERTLLRAAVCQNAGVKPASDETWAVVIGLLGATETMSDTQRESYERAAYGDGGDPFAGLPS